MKDHTTTSGLVFSPTDQCTLYALCKYYQKINPLESPTTDGSVETVVARWLSSPNPNIDRMLEHFQAHEQLRLDDVVYSLGDFKDFDEWIDSVYEMELGKERAVDPYDQVEVCAQVQAEAANVEAVSPALENVVEEWCLVGR